MAKVQDEAIKLDGLDNGVVQIGNKVPDFKLFSYDGQEHQLSDYLGMKVMLCFYSFSTCP